MTKTFLDRFKNGSKAFIREMGYEVSIKRLDDNPNRGKSNSPKTYPSFNKGSFLLGHNPIGEEIRFNEKASPHMLIAGRIGSGRTFFPQTLIKQALDSKDSWKVYASDTRKVEVTSFDGRENFLRVTSVEETFDLLDELEKELMTRYEYMEHAGVTSVFDLSDDVSRALIVIENLNDFLSGEHCETFNKKIEQLLMLGRGAGMHVVLHSYSDAEIQKISKINQCNITSRLILSKVDPITENMILNGQNSTAEFSGDRGTGYYYEFGVGTPLEFNTLYKSSQNINN